MRIRSNALLLISFLLAQPLLSQQVLLFPLEDSISATNNYIVCGTLQQQPLILKTNSGTPSEIIRVHPADMTIRRTRINPGVYGLNGESVLSYGSHGNTGVFVVQQTDGSVVRRGFFTINEKAEIETPFSLLDSSEVLGADNSDRRAFEVSFAEGKMIFYRVYPETGTSILNLDYYIIDSVSKRVSRQSHKLVTDLEYSSFSQPVYFGKTLYLAVARKKHSRNNRNFIRIYQFEEGQAKYKSIEKDIDAYEPDALSFYVDSLTGKLQLFGILKENNQPSGLYRLTLLNGNFVNEDSRSILFPPDIMKTMKAVAKRRDHVLSPEEYLLQKSMFSRENGLELIFERQQALWVDSDRAGLGFPQQQSVFSVVNNPQLPNSTQFDQIRLNDAVRQNELNNAGSNSLGRNNVNQGLRNDGYRPPSASDIPAADSRSEMKLFRGHIFSLAIKDEKVTMLASSELRLSYDQLPIRSKFSFDQSQKVMTYIPYQTDDWFILQSIRAARPVYSQMMVPQGVRLFYQDFVQIVNSCELLTIYTDQQNHLGLASIRW